MSQPSTLLHSFLPLAESLCSVPLAFFRESITGHVCFLMFSRGRPEARAPKVDPSAPGAAGGDAGARRAARGAHGHRRGAAGGGGAGEGRGGGGGAGAGEARWSHGCRGIYHEPGL